MRITAGLGRLEDLPLLAQAGADEVFIGYVPMEWLLKWGIHTPMNRREVLLTDMQLSAWDDLVLLRRMSDAYSIRPVLTFNSPFYGTEQYDYFCELLPRIAELGLCDWIIADPGLILRLKQAGVNGRIRLSGDAGTFTPDSLRFFADLGIAGCIFPRKTPIENMAACVRMFPQLEYEAFAMNENCRFSGAYCVSLHCDDLEPLCRVPFKAFGPDIPGPGEERETDPAAFGASGCGVCALEQLKRAGIGTLKVVGRGADANRIARDIRLLREALSDPDTVRREFCSGRCYYR